MEGPVLASDSIFRSIDHPFDSWGTHPNGSLASGNYLLSSTNSMYSLLSRRQISRSCLVSCFPHLELDGRHIIMDLDNLYDIRDVGRLEGIDCKKDRHNCGRTSRIV